MKYKENYFDPTKARGDLFDVSGRWQVHSSVAGNIDESEINGAWNDSPYLVVRRTGSVLPPRCIICNSAASDRLSFALRKALPRQKLLLSIFFLGLPPILIAHRLFAEKAHLMPGLCTRHIDEEKQRRRRPMVIFMVAFAMLLFVLFIAEPLEKRVGVAVPLTLLVASVCLFPAAMIYSFLRPRPLQAVQVNRHFAWVFGVSAEFLETLPAVPESQEL
jgi:hypothetical protein